MGYKIKHIEITKVFNNTIYFNMEYEKTRLFGGYRYYIEKFYCEYTDMFGDKLTAFNPHNLNTGKEFYNFDFNNAIKGSLMAKYDDYIKSDNKSIT